MISPPKLFNKHHKNAPADAVYIGRGSPWGNPFIIGKDGTREEVCDRFEKEILPTLDVSSLRGKSLVCFCAPHRCHGQAIMEKANRPFTQPLVVVFGGRNYNNYAKLYQTLDLILKELPDMMILQGGARGADIMSGYWARDRHIPSIEVPAQWRKYDKQAGFIRNQHMMDFWQPTHAVECPGGNGTAHMSSVVKKAGIPHLILTE